MSTLEININEYITEEEKKLIAKEAFKEACWLKFKDENAVQRIIENSAYGIVYKMVDETFDKNLTTVLTDKVQHLILNMQQYNLFRKPDVWSREPNSAYQILERILLDNKDLIESTVVEKLPEATIQAIKADLKEYIQNAVNRHYDCLDV
jgi:hypothetical protein